MLLNVLFIFMTFNQINFKRHINKHTFIKASLAFGKWSAVVDGQIEDNGLAVSRGELDAKTRIDLNVQSGTGTI